MGDPVSSFALGSSGGFGKPQAPAAPNYTAAALAQAAGNRTNQVTPYGNLNWSNPNPKDQNSPWTSTVDLNPQAQQTLDTQMGLSNQMGNMAQQSLGQVNTGPMDLSSVQGVQDQAYGALTSRLDPQWAQREDMQKTQLANQGIGVGSEAYSNSMRDFGNQRNDAYQQANLAAINTAPQTYQLASSIHNQPLNQFNALRSGAQVQNPTFQQPGGGANLLGAAQAQGASDMNAYSQKMGNYNAMLQGLFGLGSAGMGMG